MSIDQVQEAVSSREFSEWAAFYLIEAEIYGAVGHEGQSRSVDAQVAGWEAFVAQHNAKQAGMR